MPRGGARNRSGPPVDPASARSEARGIHLLVLPAAGFRGRTPKFPLPEPTEREIALWKRVWRTPQAWAWASEPWRHYVVGQWVRWSVKAEDPEASAAVVGAVIRFADQLGLTPAGLKENGWVIGSANALPRPAPEPDEPVPPAPVAGERRLRAVPDGQR